MPIRWRLTLFHLFTTLAIVVLLIGALAVVAIRTTILDTENLTRSRALEAARIVEAHGALEQPELARLSTDAVHIIIRDADGTVLAATPGTDLGDTDAGLWHAALTTGETQGGSIFVATADFDEEDLYVVAVPIMEAGAPVGVVEAARPYSATTMELLPFAQAAGVALLIILLAAIGGSYLSAKRALAPVNAIIHSAEEITAGDLSQRLPVKSQRDELGRLAITFNELLTRLETAFAQRETALAERQQALAQQRRFTADASHELRTPLTSILGYARMLRRWGNEDPATVREGAAAIEAQAVRMSALVEHLLELARRDEGLPLELAAQDLREVLDAAVATARSAAAGKLIIDYQPPSEPLLVECDRALIEQAALILLDNAVKFTPAGGTVTVTARSAAGGVELSVADNGIGIAPNELPHVFDRFYRADGARAQAGAGLGLAIARQIAELHDGTLRVTSTSGVGSTFTFWLAGRQHARTY